MEDLVRKEVKMMEKFKHKNIVKFLAADYMQDSSGKIALVLMEYCSKGHLLDMIHNSSKRKSFFSEELIFTIFRDILTAVELLHRHSPPITHRDLKVFFVYKKNVMNYLIMLKYI